MPEAQKSGDMRFAIYNPSTGCKSDCAHLCCKHLADREASSPLLEVGLRTASGASFPAEVRTAIRRAGRLVEGELVQKQAAGIAGGRQLSCARELFMLPVSVHGLESSCQR